MPHTWDANLRAPNELSMPGNRTCKTRRRVRQPLTLLFLHADVVAHVIQKAN
jgi:hypothetical protein